jgi:hypothetical protein
LASDPPTTDGILAAGETAAAIGHFVRDKRIGQLHGASCQGCQPRAARNMAWRVLLDPAPVSEIDKVDP